MSSVVLMSVSLPRIAAEWPHELSAEWDKRYGYRVLDGSMPVGTYATPDAAVAALLRRAKRQWKEMQS